MQKENQRFRDYWMQLGKLEKVALRRKIIDACYIQYPTVSNWLIGQCRIPVLAQKEITKIIGIDIFSDEVIEENK